ncbi:MAG: hypothetical protein M1832_003517 [Thelocarpon impressellum]|nr:MAG: hypothetical protein M1832_003517 [Thelocarpon impressellum]
MATPPQTSLSTSLEASLSLTPSPTWLASFLSTQKPTTPPASLLATARLRLLNSDIASSLSRGRPATLLPSDIHATAARAGDRRLTGPVALQVLGVEDLGKSRWAQVQDIEAAERGEGTRGREVVRVVPAAGDGGAVEGGGAGGGTHKLLLRDAAGLRVYGVELQAVKGVRVGMGIGSKIVCRNVLVSRAVLLLEPRTTTVLGGRVEGLHVAWLAGRKAELRAAVGQSPDDEA